VERDGRRNEELAEGEKDKANDNDKNVDLVVQEEEDDHSSDGTFFEEDSEDLKMDQTDCRGIEEATEPTGEKMVLAKGLAPGISDKNKKPKVGTVKSVVEGETKGEMQYGEMRNEWTVMGPDITSDTIWWEEGN
jgi:hypothetical protein